MSRVEQFPRACHPNNSLEEWEREPLQDHCGVAAVLVSGESRWLSVVGFQMLTDLQNRGQDGAGMVLVDSQGQVHQLKGEGRVPKALPETGVEQLCQTGGRLLIGQVRYGTNGKKSIENVQPFVKNYGPEDDEFIFAHNGQFSLDPDKPEGMSDTAWFAQQLAATEASDLETALIQRLAHQEGAWSLVTGSAKEQNLYLARDPRGIRPLYFAQKYDPETEVWMTVVASETVALERLGSENFVEVLPGQVLKFRHDDHNPEMIADFGGKSQAQCVFEGVYIRRSDSILNQDMRVREGRYRSGESLARLAPPPDNADVVIGIPGTAIPAGEGYAEVSGLPYAQAIMDREADDPRTFMMQLDEIEFAVMDHYKFDESDLDGKVVVLVDDSLVRGNVSGVITKILKQHYGVKEVHFRIASPPILDPCHLGINTRQKSELIATQVLAEMIQRYEQKNPEYAQRLKRFSHQEECYDQMLAELTEGVRVKIGADSLAYLSWQGMMEGFTGKPEHEGHCLGCMAGHHPPVDEYGGWLRKVAIQDRIQFY